MHGMNDLLSNNDVVRDFSPRNKTGLIRSNQRREQRFKSIDDDLSNNFIYYRIQSNGSKLFRVLGKGTFGIRDIRVLLT